MKQFISLLILFHFCSMVMGQKIKEEFTLNRLPDNATRLKFSKDRTFRYYHWNGWAGETTLDSGYYVLKRERVVLKSVVNDSLYEDQLPDTLYIKKIRLKKHESVPVFWIRTKESLFYKKCIVLTKTKFNDSLIYSNKPKNSIREFTLHKDSSLIEHVKSNELSGILISDKRIPDTCISEFRLTNRLKLVRVKYDPFCLLFRYQVGNKIYYTWYDDKINYHSAILDLFVKKKIITRKEQAELMKKVQSLM